MPLNSTNPTTGKITAVYEEDSDSVIEQKISLANDGYKQWKNKSFTERGTLFLKLAEIYKRDEQELATLMAIEMGKPITAGIAEIRKCAWAMEYYAQNAEKFLAPEQIVTEASSSQVFFEPLGVLLAIMPWNFPFWQVIRFAAPALMAGNVGILKHASNVSGSSLAIEKKFLEAGFPLGVFQSLLISSNKVEKIIRDQRVKAVALTGSEYAGKQVGKQAGEEIKKVVLELGSNDPFIIFEDADIPAACESGVLARLQNTGQSCIAAKRFIVVENRYDEFINKFKQIWESAVIGDPLDKKTEVGPIYSEEGLKSLDKQIEESVAKGAIILTGGGKLSRQGAFYQPTILINIKKGMPAYDEEIFGPVASVIKVKDEAEAIAVANDSQYGLGASIWTANKETAQRVAKQLEFGGVFVNTMVKSDPRVPFGGVKKSGHGRELSYYGIKEFVNIKTLWIK